MSEWIATTIGDIAEVFDGPHATPKKTDTGPWFLSISSLDQGRLDLTQSAHLSETDFATWTRRVTPMPGDVLFSYETRLGEAALMPDGIRACLGRRMGLLRPKTDIVNPSFLVYRYLSPEFQRVIAEHTVHGATVNRIPLNEMAAWPISLPPLKEQEAIAAILGALDDKIAVNDRIAATTLSLADTMFAGACQGVTDGPETFGSVADVFGGGTPRTSDPSYWDGPIAWTTPTDVTALTAPYLFATKRTITQEGLDSCASRLYPAGSIFMTSRATIGAFAVPQIPAAVNQGFIVVVPPRPELRWWLFHEMRSKVETMISVANGSTFLEISRKNFKIIAARIPDDEALINFHRRVDTLHNRAAAAMSENTLLAELRDTLLPKLMSGGIRIRDAEKVVEEVT